MSITFQQMLVANAPKEIPDWFQHVSPERPAKPAPESFKTKSRILIGNIDRFFDNIESDQFCAIGRFGVNENEIKNYCDEHKDSSMAEIRALLEDIYKKAEQYRQEILNWRKKDEIARMSQWPWFYSEMVIKCCPTNL